MANITIDDLTLTALADVTSAHYLAIDNGTTTTKLQALHTVIRAITNPGGGASIVKDFTLGTLEQRGLIGGTGITVTENTNDVTLTVTPGDISINALANISSFDLSLADNTTSLFLTGPIDLTSDVTGILPVANGGTGAASILNKGVMIGNGTSPVTAIQLNQDYTYLGGQANGNISVYTLTAGTNIALAQDTVNNTMTISFVPGNYIESGDSVTLGNVTTNNINVEGVVDLTSGTVTQAGSLSTAVTLNTQCGVITLVTSAITANTNSTFTLNNSNVTTSSVVLVTLESQSSAALDNGVHVGIGVVRSGSVDINVTHTGNQDATAQIRKVHFVVINPSS